MLRPRKLKSGPFLKSSKISRTMDRDILRAGKIVGVHGIKGEFKVHSFIESLDLLQPGNEVLLQKNDGEHRAYTVRKIQLYKNILRMAIDGVDDRNAAEKLIGAGLFIPRSMLPETDPDTWYWCDLIGLEVFTTDDIYVGRLTSFIETGSNDVIVINDGDAETLVPAIASVVIDIDLESGRMRVKLPEGL